MRQENLLGRRADAGEAWCGNQTPVRQPAVLPPSRCEVCRAVVRMAATGRGGTLQPVRLTAGVLAEIIAGAAERLTVVSFAAYKIARVLAALEAAATRRVRVDVILETAQDSGGALSFDQLPASDGRFDLPDSWSQSWKRGHANRARRATRASPGRTG